MSESFTVPILVPSGVYFVMASIDINDVVEESDENNSYYDSSNQIILGYPSTIQINNTFITFNDPNQQIQLSE